MSHFYWSAVYCWPLHFSLSAAIIVFINLLSKCEGETQIKINVFACQDNDKGILSMP